MTATNIAKQSLVSERTWICKHCPTKKYFREGLSCLSSDNILIKELVKIKTNKCPDESW